MKASERCPEAKHYEAYDWCELSDNICIRNTGNEDFDVTCEWYDEFLEEMTNETEEPKTQMAKGH